VCGNGKEDVIPPESLRLDVIFVAPDSTLERPSKTLLLRTTPAWLIGRQGPLAPST
jgi:hypothetical protein